MSALVHDCDETIKRAVQELRDNGASYGEIYVALTRAQVALSEEILGAALIAEQQETE